MLHIHVPPQRKLSPKQALLKPKYRSEYTEADFEAEKRTFPSINDWRLEKQKALELEEAQRAAEEEKEPWPPVWKPIQESIQYKCGLIAPFVNKRWDFEDMDDSEFFSRPNSGAYGDPEVLNKLKRFLKLVRDTRGYDVDWVPPRHFSSPFHPVHDVHGAMNAGSFFKEVVNGMLGCVVDKINSRAKNHGEEYKLVKVEKVVKALRFRMDLITFSVELVSSSSDGDGGVEKHVQALVRTNGGRKYTCLEWRFKPVEPPTEDGPTEDGPSRKRKGKPPSRNQGFVWRFSHLSNAVTALAADLEPPKKKKTKTKTETNSAKASLSPAVENQPGPPMSWREWLYIQKIVVSVVGEIR